MSIIDFTVETCRTNDILNKQIIDNFEEHFAMYSLTSIRDIENLEVSEDNSSYIVRGSEEECQDIIDKLSSYTCSNFKNTLYPVFTLITGGLKIEFKNGE